MVIIYPIDDRDFVASDAGAWNATRTSGVFSDDNNLDVTVSSVSTLTVSPGIAWMLTERFWGKVFLNNADLILPLPQADGVLGRILRVVARWDKTANRADILLLQGALSSSPVAPPRSTTDDLYDLVLADYHQHGGETEATASHLTDQRMNEDLCGLMRDGVTRIPTAMLYAQFMAHSHDIQVIIDYLYAQISAAEGGTYFEPRRTQFTDVPIPVGVWATYTAADDEETALIANGYTYKADIDLPGLLPTMIPAFTASITTISAAPTMANIARCYNSGVRFYSSSIPSADVMIRTLICWAGVN